MDGPGASFFLTNRTLFSLLLHLWQDC
jgi:hypothetical protein